MRIDLPSEELRNMSKQAIKIWEKQKRELPILFDGKYLAISERDFYLKLGENIRMCKTCALLFVAAYFAFGVFYFDYDWLRKRVKKGDDDQKETLLDHLCQVLNVPKDMIIKTTSEEKLVFV